MRRGTVLMAAGSAAGLMALFPPVEQERAWPPKFLACWDFASTGYRCSFSQLTFQLLAVAILTAIVVREMKGSG